jgi:hypothetical protein
MAALQEGDPNRDAGGWIDLETGQAWPKFTESFGDRDEDEDRHDDPDRWRFVACEGSGEGYRDMVLFADTTVADSRLAEQLDTALQGRGAFRRFRDVLARHDQLDPWYRFQSERQLGRARSWLADERLKPAVKPPPQPPRRQR